MPVFSQNKPKGSEILTAINNLVSFIVRLKYSAVNELM